MGEKKRQLRPFWRVVSNKYFITLVIGALVIFFFDEYNVRVVGRVSRQVKALQEEEMQLKRLIEEDSLNAVHILEDPDALETFGREQYYMRRRNEDIFVIQ